ncbi:hypothetical protein O3M35_012523 [Rhynocoris fuscipes]|uniref:Uncharacterized protein n=1 Tax=Rhynocoris fuscipes TaxID=488301 RepID=A0AAW1CZ47_9HEMI
MASKGLTGGISEYKTGKINKFVETKHLNSIGTQTTVQKSANSTCSNDRLSSEQSTEQSTVVQLNKSLHGSIDSLKKETSKSKFSMKFVNLNNLDQLVDEAIKFDTSIANSDSERVKCCINEIYPNFNGSGDNKSKDHNEFCLDSPRDTEKIIDDNIMKKELNQSKSAQLRECLSDLTHSGKQERLDYTNKSKQKTIYNCWQYNDIDTDKNISENNYSSSAPAAAENIAYSKSYLKDKAYRFNAEKSGNSTYSYRTQTSMLDGISQESLSLQKLSEGTPSTRTVFGLPSLQTTISTETAKTESNSTSEKNINGNPMNSSQPLAAGDSLRNHKKIVDLITECFSVNENDEMEGMNHRISHIDSTLCVEIMRKITDTLMKYQPNLLSTENVNKSVHLNILKQLRTDHLRHIQQEIKHIEDLDQFLHNFGLNNQSGDNDSKIYKLEVNLSDN